MKRWLIPLAAGLLLVGCSALPGQDGGPARQSSPADRAGAPTIDSPKNLSSRTADPCRTLLTQAQIGQLNYMPTGEFRVTATGSPSCIWRDDTSGRQVNAAVFVGTDLFVNTYRKRFLLVFRPLEIGGLPAVDIMSSPGAPSCTTTVGVADADGLDITSFRGSRSSGGAASDPCEDGHRVAEEIISTLPPK